MNPNETEIIIEPAQPRKNKILALTLIALLVAAGAIFYWQLQLNRTISTDNAKVSSDTVDISAKISGRLEKLAVAEGDTVKAGQIIAWLDNSQYKTTLEQAAANLDLAKTNQQKLPMDLKAAQAGYARSQDAVLVAQAQLKSSQISLADAKRILDKNLALKNAGAISQEALDKSQSDYDKAQAAIEVSQANLLTAQATLTESEAKKESVDQTGAASYLSQLKLSQAAYNAALLNYNNSFIKAPISGTVVRVTVQVGENLAAAQTLLTLCNMDSTWVTANIDEKKVGRILPGQKVDVRIDAYPGKVFAGRVETVAGTTKSVFAVLSTENSSGNYTKVVQYLPVKIAVDHAGLVLRAGMSATVKIYTQS